jgi:hypothetical protein
LSILQIYRVKEREREKERERKTGRCFLKEVKNIMHEQQSYTQHLQTTTMQKFRKTGK